MRRFGLLILLGLLATGAEARSFKPETFADSHPYEPYNTHVGFDQTMEMLLGEVALNSFIQARVPGPGGTPPVVGTNMALTCAVGATNDASGTVLTTPAAICTGANTFYASYEEGGNSTIAITDSQTCTYLDPTNFTVVNSGALFQDVASNCTGSATHTFTSTSGSAETFRRLMVLGFTNGNVAGAVDGNGAVNSGSVSPATVSNLTPSAGGGVVILAASNNDGSTCAFTANNSFILNFGTNGTLNGTNTFDTNSQYILNQTGSVPLSMAMSATGGAWRAVGLVLKK